MLHQDYLVRMFTILAVAMRKSIIEANQKKDPEACADLLEDALTNATEIDGNLLLKMDPATMVSMLKISRTDPTLMGFVARTLLLESTYLTQTNLSARATLRKNQAFALANAYGFELSEEDITPDALDDFFQKVLPAEDEEDAKSEAEEH